MVGVDFDFSDVDDFFRQGESEIKEVEEKVGKEAVDYAVQHGSYQNRTGTLRKSNEYTVSDEGLTLFNGATSPKGTQYASYVESKGYEVLSGAALFATRRLKEEIE